MTTVRPSRCGCHGGDSGRGGQPRKYYEMGNLGQYNRLFIKGSVQNAVHNIPVMIEYTPVSGIGISPCSLGTVRRCRVSYGKRTLLPSVQKVACLRCLVLLPLTLAKGCCSCWRCFFNTHLNTTLH